MQSVFPEWYEEPADAKRTRIGKFMMTGTIAFDASALLELYRSNRADRKQILDVLDKVQDRLFIPYQAALEYQRRRCGSISDRSMLFDTILANYKSMQNKSLNSLNAADASRIKKVWADFAPALETVVSELRDEYGISLATSQTDDDVRNTLDRLLTKDRLGKEPTPEQLRQRYAEFDIRHLKGIPPGYQDAHKGAPLMYGDNLIWHELLEYAAASDRPLLFVSNDQKDDWYDKATGSPRRELALEMLSVSDTEYHHMTLKTFLHNAKTHLGAGIEEATIANVDDSTTEVGTGTSPQFLQGITLLPPDIADELKQNVMDDTKPKVPDYSGQLSESLRAWFTDELKSAGTLRVLADIREDNARIIQEALFGAGPNEMRARNARHAGEAVRRGIAAVTGSGEPDTAVTEARRGGETG